MSNQTNQIAFDIAFFVNQMILYGIFNYITQALYRETLNNMVTVPSPSLRQVMHYISVTQSRLMPSHIEKVKWLDVLPKFNG